MYGFGKHEPEQKKNEEILTMWSEEESDRATSKSAMFLYYPKVIMNFC